MAFDPRTHYQDHRTAEEYDRERFSSLSGKVFQWAERRSLEQIVRRLPRGSRILDAPCGTGRLLDLFLRLDLTVVCADISAEMLAVARSRTLQWNGRISFSRMDLNQIPLADRSVAATFSIRFLPHIPPDERALMLREFRRVSQSWVVLSLSLSTPWHRFRRRIKRWLGHSAPVRHPVTSEALAVELRQAGLREVRRVWTCPLLSEQVLVACERG